MESESVRGPAAERLPNWAAARTAEQFDQTIGALTEGALSFPYPFNLATSVALGGNAETGPRAISQFGLLVRAYRPRFQVQIHEVGPDGFVRREIVGTIVNDMQLALPLIEQAATDLDSE